MKEGDTVICIKDFIGKAPGIPELHFNIGVKYNVIFFQVAPYVNAYVKIKNGFYADYFFIRKEGDKDDSPIFKDYFCTEAEFRSERLKKLLA